MANQQLIIHAMWNAARNKKTLRSAPHHEVMVLYRFLSKDF
jgi:hypothetical protein